MASETEEILVRDTRIELRPTAVDRIARLRRWELRLNLLCPDARPQTTSWEFQLAPGGLSLGVVDLPLIHLSERMVHHAKQQTAKGLAGTPRTLSAAEHQDIED